jgi:hypothetical protein
LHLYKLFNIALLNCHQNNRGYLDKLRHINVGLCLQNILRIKYH